MLGNQRKRKGHTTTPLKIRFVILSIKLQMMFNYKVETFQWIACTQVYCWLITCVGTLNHSCQGIPTELKNTSKWEKLSVTCYYESIKKDLCLFSYTVKTKSSGKKNVLFLFTMRPLNGITRDGNERKSGIYKFYDFIKGVTDIVDQLNEYYTMSQSNRWDLGGFCYILDNTCEF